ncbi:HYR domain-containing protein, partial [Mariprofundus sp. EBB-1]|uniref:HYR domain-containing protein n=1 Tax=Mariprofundus sp. EBB-1 TaxID=2650971 RepID=UPI000EF266B8
MNHRLFYSALLPAFCNSTTWQVGIINRSLARFTSGLADHAKPAALCLTMLAATLVAAPAQAAGPVVSFDASTLALTNGAVVSAWGGQSAAGTPTYLSAQTPNGSPAVEFNGSDHMGNNITLPAAGGDWILVAVIKPTNIHAYHNLADDSAGARPMLWIDPAFNYELNYGGGGGAKAAGTGTGGWDVVIADSSLNQLYVNSPTANASGGGAVSYTAAKLFNFFHRGGGQTFQGQVAELRIYNNRTDFGGNFSALYNEMHAKWIAAPAAVPPYFLETFNSNTLGPNLTQLEGASVNLSGANVTTTGGWGVPKQLVATIGTNYDTIDFVAEVTVVAHNQSTCSDEVYFGLGKAGTGGTGGYPLDGPVALLRHITMWAGTCSANANINNLTIATNDIPAFPGHGTEITNQSNVGPGFGPYVLQFYHVAGMVSFFVNGVQFGPTVDASQYYFAAGAGRVFFAGVNVKFDDFSIQAIPPANAAPTANAGAVQTAQCTGISSADVAMDGSGSSDPDGDTLTYAWSWTGGSATGLSPTASFPLGTTTVTLTVDDGNGETATSNTSVTVEDTTAPTVNAGSDVIVEATSAAGADYDVSAQVSASDTCCNVSTSISPIGTYSLGANTVSVTASDCAGNSASDTMVVTVVDTTVPVLTVPANVSIEANGVLSTVIIGTATATDLFGATVANDAPAIFALGTTTVTYTATDGNGLTSTGTQTVTVADTTA